jgi:hypothetical protein
LQLKDKYMEMKSIDGVGVCYYYRGNTSVANYYHSNLAGLSKMECDLLNDHYRKEQILD